MKVWIGKNKSLLALMLCISTIPMIWAVLSPNMGIHTGAVSLVCAAVYSANGNKRKDGLKLSIGFLCGDLWAVLFMFLTDKFNLHSELKQFVILFIVGSLSVLISGILNKLISLPALLCGWALGMLIMAPLGIHKLSTLPLQIGISMLVGVWYIGEGVNLFHGLLCKPTKKNNCINNELE